MTDIDAYFRQLVGFTITGFRMVADDDEYGSGDDAFPTFTAQAPTGETLDIQLSRDPEGNGGGFAFIGPVERKASA